MWTYSGNRYWHVILPLSRCWHRMWTVDISIQLPPSHQRLTAKISRKFYFFPMWQSNILVPLHLSMLSSHLNCCLPLACAPFALPSNLAFSRFLCLVTCLFNILLVEPWSRKAMLFSFPVCTFFICNCVFQWCSLQFSVHGFL